MSLQSTYQSRKALLVNNLETMGVTGYSSDDGLTTLIDAILEIAPTPTTYDGITISADTIVEKGNTLTLTSQLTLNGIPVTVPNISIDWYEDGTLFDTILTDNNGQTTYTYSATGTGDIPIKAQTDSLTDTITIEDCLDYQPMTSNIHQSRWTIPSAVTSASIFGYSSDGWKYGNAPSYSNMKLNTILPEYPFSIELTVHSKSGMAPSILVENENGNYMGFVHNDQNQFVYLQSGAGMSTSNVNYDALSNTKIRIEVTSSAFKTYVNDVLFDTRSHTLNNINTKLRLDTGNNRWCVINNLKIKPL